MLSASGADQEKWMGQARETALDSFGRKVFIRAVMEVSNFCRENCHYCGMRRDNRALPRFRAQVEQFADILLNHRPASVTDINFQAGEDPVAVRRIVLPLVRLLREKTDLGISVALGTLDESLYSELQEAGAGMYILKFETCDSTLYDRLQAPGRLPERLEHIRLLARTGWFVSSGFICGLPGQTMQGIVRSLETAKSLPLGGCSVSPFIPGESTPLAGAQSADLDKAVNCMAALRIMNPNWVIPAVSALNLSDPAQGYLKGLQAGANLCTINLTPESHRGDYLIYKKDRCIMSESRILDAIELAGLEPSTRSLANRFWNAHQEKVSVHTSKSF